MHTLLSNSFSPFNESMPNQSYPSLNTNLPTIVFIFESGGKYRHFESGRPGDADDIATKGILCPPGHRVLVGQSLASDFKNFCRSNLERRVRIRTEVCLCHRIMGQPSPCQSWYIRSPQSIIRKPFPAALHTPYCIRIFYLGT
jgi:hypothetical protein